MGRPILYYMCKYTPVELFAGFGTVCERLEPDTDSFDTAESIGHPNMCGYGKGLLEAVVKKQVKELVLVNCCDVVRRIYDILQRRGGMDFLYLLDLPHKAGPAEVLLLEAQLRKLAAAYGRHCGQVFSEKAFLRAWEGESSCGLCGDTGTLPSLRLPFEQVAAEQGLYISLAGAHSGAFLADLIREHLPVTVRDETCVGNRVLPRTGQQFFMPDAEHEGRGPSGEALRAYAESLLGQVPCMRMTDITGRAALGEGAAGIVYHTMKFCDYYGFEYAALPPEGGPPVLKIETDGTRQSEGQLATRLDAFAEGLHMEKKTEQTVRTGQYTAGVDSGSASTDAAILDPEGRLVGWAVVKTGAGAAAGAEKALQQAMEMAGIGPQDLRKVVSTGYGRETIGMGDASVTEITCHARGAHWLMPSVRTVIDIGGQDSKIISVDGHGAVVSFAMNDKCAAGTGRFLEMMARTMDMSMEEMSTRGLKWKEDVHISSMCTVFAESEVVSLIARNTDPADIIHGLNESVAARTAALLKRVGGRGDYMMTGGVAKDRGVVEVLEKRLGEKIHVHEHAQICGAIGAALAARD